MSERVPSSLPHVVRKRPSLVGEFLPLPTINASPVCTSSASSTASNEDDCSNSIHSDSGMSGTFVTAPVTPSELSPVRNTPSRPTWVSIPPTPPPALCPRTVICRTQRSKSTTIRHSTSLPAHAHLQPIINTSARPLRRRASHPVVTRRVHASKRTLAENRSEQCRSPLVSLQLPPTKESSACASSDMPSFEVSHHVSSDVDLPHASNVDLPQVNARNGVDEAWLKEKAKDNVRKYHALMELVTTEVAYLMDLRLLLLVYLRNLPTLTYRIPTYGRSTSFPSISLASSVAQPYSSRHEVQCVQPLTPVKDKDKTDKDKEKSSSRAILSTTEMKLLTRNAEEILSLHEHFVQELRAALTPLGFSMDYRQPLQDLEISDQQQAHGIRNVDVGINIVSSKFATESSRFNAYTEYCAGHPEALDIVRRIQSQYPYEWDVFDQRASALVSHVLDFADHEAEINMNDALQTGEELISKEHKRTASFSSMDDAVRTIRGRTNSSKENVNDVQRVKKSKRLAFVDYLIKPVQRICKYPLLFDQLKASKAVSEAPFGRSRGRQDADVIVDSATQAMKHVAALVDEARYRQGVAMQTSLIMSRICLATPVPTSSSEDSCFEVITPSFLSSLGVCLLAGSLDVLHQQGSKSAAGIMNAKYLGAFLYLGGYLILVKVGKGKLYEPRHWFCLRYFDIVDVGEEDAMLPYSFRLSCKGHCFELATACQQEKVAWLTSIRESLTRSSDHWINEPLSSLRVEGKGEMVPSTLDGPFEAVDALPTIRSISDLAKDSKDSNNESANGTVRSRKESLKSEQGSSRRSSSASVKAIFMPLSSDNDTVLVRRSSASGRAHVDLGLQDVISEPCIAARSLATRREQELFRASTLSRPRSTSRTATNLNLNLATRRLKRHDSVRVPRRNIDDAQSSPTKPVFRAQSLAHRKRKRFSIASANSEADGLVFPPSSFRLSPGSGPSVPDSNSSSAHNSVTSSPTNESPGILSAPPEFTTVSITLEAASSRPRVSPSSSLVGNVREFFGNPWAQPAQRATIAGPIPEPPTTRDRLMRWMSNKSTKHKRSRSAPDGDTLEGVLNAQSVLDITVDRRFTESPTGLKSSNTDSQVAT